MLKITEIEHVFLTLFRAVCFLERLHGQEQIDDRAGRGGDFFREFLVFRVACKLLQFADFLFYQGLERNTAIAVVCDKGKMFGARIQFPDQFYIGFDIIVVDESSQVSSLVFQVFYIYTFGSPFRYVYITVR